MTRKNAAASSAKALTPKKPARQVLEIDVQLDDGAKNARAPARKRGQYYMPTNVAVARPRGFQIAAGQTNHILAEYARSLINPFGGSARVPSRVAPMSSVFSIKNKINVVPRINPVTGVLELVFLLKGGIGANYATFKDIEFGEFHNSLVSWAPGPAAPWVTDDYPPAATPSLDWNYGGTGDSPGLVWWDGTPEATAIINSFVAYRKVSQGLRVTYTGPALTARGRCVIATIPGGQSPELYLSTAAVPVPGQFQGMVPVGNQVLSFDAIATLLDAQTFAAAEGVTHVWAPQGDGIDEWRPTKYFPVGAQAWGAFIGTTAAPCCDTDPERFCAYADSIVSPASAFIPGVGIQGISGATVRTMAVTSYLGLTNMVSMYDPIVIFAATDLDPDASYQFEWITNYEGIADNRTFSLVTPSGVAAHPALGEVRRLSSDMPRITPGPHGDRLFGKIANGVSTAIAIGRNIYDVGKRVLPVASQAMRNMGLNGEADIADAIASATSVGDLAELASLALA